MGSGQRFSIGLPHFDAAPDFTRFDDQIAIAQSIEAARIDACSVTDHPFPTVDDTRTGHHTFDPFVLLACVARATSRLGVHIQAVVLPYRNPFLLANSLLTLDNAAGPGRLVAALGAGYLVPEFAALGVSFEDRDELMEENLRALELAWRGESVHASTGRWTASGNTMRPLPATTPHPTLWMGGNSRRAIDRAARLCDGWTPVWLPPDRATNTRTASISSLEDLDGRIRLLRELCERNERTAPIEIALVNSRLDLADGPAALGEKIAEFEQLGVTWLSLRVAASSTADMLERVAAWGEVAARYSSAT